MILRTIGAPPSGVGLILGADRFLDMYRTILNVVGDLVVATVIARGEGTAVPAPSARYSRAKAAREES